MTCGYLPSVGTQLQRLDETGGADVWETIAGVLEMPEINITAGTAQCNDFDSVVSGFTEYFKNGKFEFAEMTFTLGVIEGNPVQEKLYQDTFRVGDDAGTGEKEAVGFRLLLPTATVTTFEWKALVTGYSLPIVTPDSDDNKLTNPLTLQPTGGLTRIL